MLDRAPERRRQRRQRNTEVQALAAFVRAQRKDFRLRMLTAMAPSRVVSLRAFDNFFRSKTIGKASVAVVSGSVNEPELSFLSEGIEVHFLSYEENPALFDLGKDWSHSRWIEYHHRYDVVLCEQVLEHLLDPKLAIQNLSQILSPNGILHLSVPAIDNRHGEPHFYYAGFATELIEHWLRGLGLVVLDVSSWDSDKGSRMHSTSDWAPLAVSGPGIFFFEALFLLRRDLGKVVHLFFRRVQNHLKYPFQALFPAQRTKNAVVVWAFASAPKNG